MALGLFISFSTAQLIEMRDSAQTQMIDGKNRVITGAGSGDVNSQKAWQLEPAVFWEELNWALMRSGSLSRKVTRTTPRYV